MNPWTPAEVIACFGAISTLVVLIGKTVVDTVLAVKAARQVAEVKSDLATNTATTKAVENKADTIVEQTNGALEHTRVLVASTAERVAKLEDYNRDSSHRMLDALNAIGLKVERLMAIEEAKQRLVTPSTPVVHTGPPPFGGSK